ncbi:hypothetical protein IWZ01DRAFT_502263 [Phyllosticta capitalensis]
MITTIFFALSLIPSATLAAAVDEATCYFPNREIDTDGYVCNTTAAANGDGSACCLHNDACYESGTCYQDWSGISYRRSCTDKDWRSGNCPDYCLDDASQGDYARITQCVTDTAASCCVTNGTESCCDGNTTNYFTWKPGYIQAVINGDGTNRLGPYVSANGVTQGVASSTAAATSTSSTSAASTTAASCESTVPLEDKGTSKGKTAATVTSGFFGAAFALSFTSMMVFWMKFRREKALRMREQQQYQDQLQMPVQDKSYPLLELSGAERSEMEAREVPKHDSHSGQL